jgi:hypothetical protein
MSEFGLAVLGGAAAIAVAVFQTDISPFRYDDPRGRRLVTMASRLSFIAIGVPAAVVPAAVKRPTQRSSPMRRADAAQFTAAR